MMQPAASSLRAARIERDRSLLDMLDLAVFIDHKGGAVGHPGRRNQDAVILGHFTLGKVAENRKTEVQLTRKLFLRGSVVCADAKNLCICSFKFGDTSLVRQHFLRSTTGKC